MHIQFLATLATLVATGLSASATANPHPAAAIAHPHVGVFQARNHGRRLSRKMHLAPRHGRHGTTTVTEYTTITSSTDVPTQAAGTATTTVTVYTTITSSAPAEPTSTESSSTDEGSSSTSEEAPTSTEEVPTSTESASPTSSESPAPTESRGPVIVATGGQCGDPRGTENPTATGGPNGDENWLNCGVDGDGWVPPPVTFNNLIYKDLAAVLQKPGNPFAACNDYLSIFQDMERETTVPAIFLASIALQESGCRADVTGGATEIGLMQITPEKCPSDGSNCYDPATNIRIGAQYFKTVLDLNNGNVAAAMGNYNGWYHGLTVALANNYAVCAQHNNLDYLQNVFNGYLQGVDPSSLNMGIYHNTC